MGFWSKAWGALKEAFNPFEVLRELGLFALLEGGAKGAGKELGAHAAKKLLEEYRAELFAYLTTMRDRVAAENILRRQRLRQLRGARTYGAHQPYGPVDEFIMIGLLTKLYRDLDDPAEFHIRDEAFRRIGHMEDQEFDENLLFLRHDVVRQWASYAREVASDIAEVVADIFGVAVDQVVAFAAWLMPIVTAVVEAVVDGVITTAHEVDDLLEDVAAPGGAFHTHVVNLEARKDAQKPQGWFQKYIWF